MYNNEAARVRTGIGGVAGREMTNKKGGRGERRRTRWGGGLELGVEGVFHVSPEFERPPFHVSIVIFRLFSFH